MYASELICPNKLHDECVTPPTARYFLKFKFMENKHFVNIDVFMENLKITIYIAYMDKPVIGLRVFTVNLLL